MREAAKRARQRFTRARRAEVQYGRQLVRIAGHVGDLVRMLAPKGFVQDLDALLGSLRRYGESLRPWATAVARRMVEDVSRRDRSAWFEHARQIGESLREEIDKAPTGRAMRESIARQVELITSLPTEAAERVHRLTQTATHEGTRAAETAREIMRTGAVTKSRAMLIARTETSRAAAELTQARALAVGSEGYIWRTAEDSDVRDDHKKLNGRFFRWDSPPVADQRANVRAMPGAIYNCRCYAEPVLPEL